MTRSGSRALVPLLALALLAPAAPRGEEPPPPAESAPEPPPRPPPDAPGSPAPQAPAPGKPEGTAAEDTWLDTGHAFIEHKIFAPILRLDRFFSDERDLEPERSRSFLRWRSEVRYAEDASRPAFTTGIRATLRLPGLNERLRRFRLVIAGDTRDTIDKLFPKEPATTATPVVPSTDEDALGSADAGLRFYLWDTLASHADLGGGVLLELPPGVYGRVRFRWAIPVGKLFLSRFAVVGFWRSDVKFGTTMSGEIERGVWRSTFLRLSGNGTVSERSNGLEWFSELALLVPLPPRAAAQIGLSMTGATDATVFAPDPATGISRAWRVPGTDRTRAYARLRRDVYRRWLFFEVEPEIAWPWTPERGRYAAWGLTLRMEVQFQGKEAPPPAPPPPPPEPADPPS